jgi:outer membrane protein assembly factor BamB
MSAIEVVVRPRPETLPSSALEPLRGLLDVIVDGVNITARVGESESLTLLGDLGRATNELSRGQRDRAVLPLYADDEAWEIGLEADATDVLISVYRVGPYPHVAVHERRVDLVNFRAALSRAIAEARARGLSPRSERSLEAVGRDLSTPWPSYGRRALDVRPISIAVRAPGPFGLSAEFRLRCRTRSASGIALSDVERADLHALLAEGSISASARRRSVRIDQSQPFLVAERLLALADEVLDSYRTGRALFRRVSVGGVQLAVQRGPAGKVQLTFAGREANRDHEGVTLPEISPTSFVLAALRFARELGAAWVEVDASQSRNLRLSALLSAASELEAGVADATAEDSLTNPEPERYRAFGLPRSQPERALWDHGAKMRFQPRWVATVSNIDLGATFHCGSRFVIGSQRETSCLESNSGRVLWRVPGAAVGSVATPLGIARLHADGRVELIELETGEPKFVTRLKPRAAGGASGALVNAHGLPRLLVLGEGDRSVTALDLVSGEVRWRYTAKRPASYRLRRAGKLLLVAGGDSALIALDVATGELVWRLRDRLPFSGALAVHNDAAFALAGGPIGPSRLFHVDLWTGALRWMRDLDERPTPTQAPLVTALAIVVPVRDRRGSGALAFHRETGEPLWAHEPGLSSPTTAWLALDSEVVANSASGVVFCLDADTGVMRYNHVFSRHVEADKPRRLEPVLRNGALFVPQHQVHVIRPRDGDLLGSVPSDLIPDLLRVDENCSVYLAEESGHVAAFGVAPKLSLVQ